jgi:dipeptidase
LQDAAILDYGNLIWITLQRSKTAREAIGHMTDLVSKYGYASEGESFSIGDPNELWILEMIGKGQMELGAVWVAMRIPNGHVSGHANQVLSLSPSPSLGLYFSTPSL